MTTIQPRPHYPNGTFYQSGNNVAKTAASAENTDSRSFAESHAHLSASGYVFAKLAFSEQTSAERLAAGEASEVFSVRFQNRVFEIAGKRLDRSQLEVSNNPELKVTIAQEKGPSRLDIEV